MQKKIQNIFTKLRNALNAREDELLNDVEKMFDELYFNGNKISDYQKLPNKIKISLEQGKKIDTDFNDENKLIYFINNCINIENNITQIKELNKKKEKFSEVKVEIKFNLEEDLIDNYINKIQTFGYIYHNEKNGFKLLKKPINISDKNKVLLLTNNKSPILNNLLKFNNAVNKIDIQSPNILTNMKFANMQNYKIMIYDLNNSGFEQTSNPEEFEKYLSNGGNIIITHDQWTYYNRKASANAKLLGAKIQHQNYNVTKKAKIFNNNHPIFTSFYNLYMNNQKIIDISETHKTDTIYENKEEFEKDLLIELDDNKHGEYLLIKEIDKGKLIFWNTGHTCNLTDYEKKLFMNFIYWVCQ